MRFSLLLLSLALVVKAAGQPSGEEKLSGNAAKAAEFATAESARYTIERQDSGKQKLELMPKPILRWSNPLVGDIHGAVYFWTHNGCPEAAASIYQFFNRKQLNVELISLAEVPLTGTRNKKVRWTPEAGLKFQPLPGSPAPAATPEQRQFQMRALGRKFSAHLSDRDNEKKQMDLRLMARPLHQYKATDNSGREGAVFAFVTTNDPEVILLIESRPGKNGREWLWAASRMHFCQLQLKLGDKVVWKVAQDAPPWEKLRGPAGQYVILEWPDAESAARD